MDRRTFIKESLLLGFSQEEVFELAKIGYTDARDGDITKDIGNVSLELKGKKPHDKPVEQPKEDEKKYIETSTDGKRTIHAVIMEGLRGGKLNPDILIDLKKEHPEVDEKKLKQRIYEYRNHFNKGKIK